MAPDLWTRMGLPRLKVVIGPRHLGRADITTVCHMSFVSYAPVLLTLFSPSSAGPISQSADAGPLPTTTPPRGFHSDQRYKEVLHPHGGDQGGRPGIRELRRGRERGPFIIKSAFFRSSTPFPYCLKHERMSQASEYAGERELMAYENAFQAARRDTDEPRKFDVDACAPSAYFRFLQRVCSDPELVKEIFGDETDPTKRSILADAKWSSMTDEERKVRANPPSNQCHQ